MRILYATGRPHLPDRRAGAAQCLHELLSRLERRGHACEALVALPPGGSLTLARAAQRLGWRLPFRRHARNGYPTRRLPPDAILEGFPARLARFRPDLVVTQLDGSAEIARTAAAAGVPAIVRACDAHEWGYAALRDAERVALLSVSHFIVSHLRGIGLHSSLLRPLVDADRYRAAVRSPRFVTFVNPVAAKGLDIALELARRLHDQPFLFQECWALTPKRRRALERELVALPNVQFRAVTDDMRSVYADTRLLIVPSHWGEAFPRVVIEAQWNGIPVVGSADGGLPEAIAEGGSVLPVDAPAERWEGTLRRYLDDAAFFEERAQRARESASRPELDPERIVDAFLVHAERLLGRGTCDNRGSF